MDPSHRLVDKETKLGLKIGLYLVAGIYLLSILLVL